MPGCVWFRCYAELNEFLSRSRRWHTFRLAFNQPASIKDMVESLGIPHTEVDLILINGESVDFSHIVHNGDRVSVYPHFSIMDISNISRCHPPPLPAVRFILDGHLGRLSAYLRMLGFDCRYNNSLDDPTLADISASEQRILLTRDRKLLMRKQVVYGYYVRETHPRRQLLEILTRFRLHNRLSPFSRCMKCNSDLTAISKVEAIASVPPLAAARHDEFRQCLRCKKIYWQGTHFQRMKRFISRIEKDFSKAETEKNGTKDYAGTEIR